MKAEVLLDDDDVILFFLLKAFYFLQLTEGNALIEMCPIKI